MKKKYIHPSATLLIGLLSLHTFFSCVNTKPTSCLTVKTGKIGLVLSTMLLLPFGSEPVPYGSDLERLDHLKKVSKLGFNQVFKLNPIRAGSDTIIDPPCVQSNEGCVRREIVNRYF